MNSLDSSNEVPFEDTNATPVGVPGIGCLEITYGPMGCRKTFTATSEATTWSGEPYYCRVLYINNILDKGRKTAGGEEGKFSSHHESNIKMGENVKTLYVSNLSEARDYKDYDIIVIDEGQFYTDLVSEVKKFIAAGKKVSLYGLIGDARGEKFGSMLDLFPVADKVTQLFSSCSQCLLTASKGKYKPAPFTARYEEDQGQIAVGGMDLYYACCRKHHPILTKQ